MIVITSFQPFNGQPARLRFWQTPWLTQSADGAWREVGGWVNSSMHATQYTSLEEAQAVNAFRALGGRAREFLTEPRQA